METIFVIGSDLRRETPLISHWVKKAANKGANIKALSHDQQRE